MKDNIIYIDEIKQILPHRYPFLMVDRVIDVVPEKSGVGIKNVTANEEFFNGHFPSTPTMPGVLMLEAMCQTAVLVGSTSDTDEKKGQIVLLTGIDNAKFKEKVIPGDTLIFRLELLAPIRRGVCYMKATCFVGEKIVCEAELMAQISKKQ